MIGTYRGLYADKVYIERNMIMKKITGYIGTYASKDSQGIYHFSFDLNKQSFDDTSLFYPVRDAKYVSLCNHIITAPCMEENAGICRIDEMYKEPASKLFMEDTPACYVIQKDDFIYTANYHEGSVMVYKVVNQQIQFHHKISIAPKAGCHQVIVYGKYIAVPCLLLDKIAIFDTSANYIHVKDIWFDSGSGPRHGIFDKQQTLFYVVSELSNEVFVYKADELNFTLIKKIALPIPCGAKAASAALRLSEDEQYAYVSIRDINLICVIDTKSLTLIQSIESGGDHPRDMALSPDGDYVFVVHRFSNNLVVFKRDKETGKLQEKITETQIFEGVSIVFQEEE